MVLVQAGSHGALAALNRLPCRYKSSFVVVAGQTQSLSRLMGNLPCHMNFKAAMCFVSAGNSGLESPC